MPGLFTALLFLEKLSNICQAQISRRFYRIPEFYVPIYRYVCKAVYDWGEAKKFRLSS